MWTKVFSEVLVNILVNSLRNLQILFKVFQRILFYVSHDWSYFLWSRVFQLLADWVEITSYLSLILNCYEFKLDESPQQCLDGWCDSVVLVDAFKNRLKLLFKLAARVFLIPTLLFSFNFMEVGLVTSPKDFVLEIYFIHLSRNLMETVHVQLNKATLTCLTNEPKLLCRK